MNDIKIYGKNKGLCFHCERMNHLFVMLIDNKEVTFIHLNILLIVTVSVTENEKDICPRGSSVSFIQVNHHS